MYALAAPDSLEAPWFTSTGDVRALVDQLTTATNGLNADVTAWYNSSAKGAPENGFVNAWVVWRDDTYAWIKAFHGYITYLAWNQYDIAAAKLAELIKWRDEFERVSGRVASGPKITLPTGAQPIDLSAWVKTGLIVLGVGGALYLGTKLYLLHKARKAFTPSLTGARRRRFAR